MKSASSNVVCLKHPHYDATSNPDLSCKVCCTKFVSKIRQDQIAFTAKHPAESNQAFSAVSASQKQSFDGSWI